MKNKLFKVAGGILVLALVVWLGLPRLLNTLGLHGHYDIPPMDLSRKRALIITTSQATLGDTGKATGVFASEMTVPYYAFTDAGMAVDLASIRGGAIPIEPGSQGWPLATEADRRSLADPTFQAKVQQSLEIGAVNIRQYDIVFLAGGWGAAYDLGQSAPLGEKMTEAYANQAVIGGVCHGPLGLLNAKASRRLAAGAGTADYRGHRQADRGAWDHLHADAPGARSARRRGRLRGGKQVP